MGVNLSIYRIHSSAKCIYPVQLPAAAYSFHPFVFCFFERYAPEDCLDRALESWKISLRSYPYYCSAFRAPVSLQPQSLFKQIKISNHIPVSPQPVPFTSRALTGALPSVFFLFFIICLRFIFLNIIIPLSFFLGR